MEWNGDGKEESTPVAHINKCLVRVHVPYPGLLPLGMCIMKFFNLTGGQRSYT